MQIPLERIKSIGRKLGLDDEKGYIIAILLALIIVASIVAVYFVVYRPQPEPYSTIYILDDQKQAANYAQTLVAGENSTFNVWVNVENHMGGSGNQSYQVLVKIAQNPSTYPVEVKPIYTYQISLADGGKWQNLTPITENQVGSYSVVFELWLYNSESSAYEFTHNFCDLNIQVIS